MPGMLLVLVLAAFAVVVVGCHGLGETAAERSNDHNRQLNLNNQMMTDDVDVILETDRPSRLTEYTVR